MDIHQIMQYTGQVMYILLKTFCAWIERLSGAIGAFLIGLRIPPIPSAMKIFSNTTVNRAVFFVILLYAAAVNIAAIAMYGADKKNAEGGKRRIPERRLIGICVLGGAPGGFLGMMLFRHKTQHKKFSVCVPILFAVQLILYSFLLGFLGFWALL